MTDFADLMRLKEQSLRTRVMVLEYSIGKFLRDGDREKLESAYSNEWVQPLEGNIMSDPFAQIRVLARKREEVQHEWSQEIKQLHAAGFSLRTIADVAGVSHDTVWRKVK